VPGDSQSLGCEQIAPYANDDRTAGKGIVMLTLAAAAVVMALETTVMNNPALARFAKDATQHNREPDAITPLPLLMAR